MTRLVSVILVLICQNGLSIQTCRECVCCRDGTNNCDSNRNCVYGCIDGYYGSKCTAECLENCKTCVNSFGCTECKPGYFTYECNLSCGNGCLNNTCSVLSGECPCKSTNFVHGKCDACSGLMYGDECNYSCPSNCGNCISDTECEWCKNTIYHGSYCQYRCSVGCIGGRCDKRNGHCTAGCNPGFIGDKCDTCSPGLYAPYCDLNCKENCKACFGATNCTACKSGFYGETCTNTCPFGCKGNCSFADGRCLECKLGLFGEFCNITCKDGTYGEDCSELCRNKDVNCQVCTLNELGGYGGCTQCHRGYHPVIFNNYNHSICKSCPKNCNGNICDNAGLCEDGCVRGKWGDTCTDNCKPNCVECNQRDGKCFQCTNDTFSDDCLQKCSANCNMTDNDRVCARDTGTCLHGCNTVEKYGEYCDNQCSNACINKSCIWKTGQCLEGCEMDFYGLFCNNSCSNSCLSHTSKRTCDGIKGHCSFGCKAGFHGKRCDNICSSLCVNTTCNQTTAECLYGCIDGFKGPKCAEADLKGYYTRSTLIGSTIGTFLAGGIIVGIAALITFIVWRRRNIQTKQLEVHGYENTIGPCGNLSYDDTHENDSPVTYEDLKSRDERLYSQITTSQQETPPATDYVNYSS
ncbi:cell death abnormality protein 1-like [Ruditapes philippinarum]|uniref:cell death abnormality protein 1-like n=1 Tax=Ruditapes philippinarum TaxID=129788 RepID=UPI00295C3815|nr:cell death abnormality protein 1-like [Ruditapes philippinarum]